MPPRTDPTVERLQAHLRAVAGRYPLAWDQIASFRRERKDLGDWPAWCYCPLAGAYAVVSGGGDQVVPPGRGLDVGVVGALAAWRATQGVYRIDPDLLPALWDTPVSGALPDDLLFRLPEWCVYVETSHAPTIAGERLAGFFAHLEYDANGARAELRVLLDQAPSRPRSRSAGL